MSEWELLKTSKKISSTKEPTLAGRSFLARIIYLIDGDTAVVARVNSMQQLEKRTCRITMIDCAEIAHSKSKAGEAAPSQYEQAVGAISKNVVLHTMLPDQFDVLDADVYDWRKQQKIFDLHPVMVRVNCPATDSAGKPKQPDPYKRELGSVSILQHPDDKGVDVAELLISKGLVDHYEGGTKPRSFMKDTKFIQTQLGSVCSSDICNKLLQMYNDLPASARQ